MNINNNNVTSYKDLLVWQKAFALAEEIYLVTNNFPVSERYGLISQMQRAAVSICSNIAEGKYRGSAQSYLSFLRIAYGSGAELETQLQLAKKVLHIPDQKFIRSQELLQEVMKMLNSITYKLSLETRSAT